MAIGPEQITSIAAAAAEIQSHYILFHQVAPLCDFAYIKFLMAGKKDETWRLLSESPQIKVPILPYVIHHDGRIKLGPECDHATGIRCRYYLSSSDADEIINLHVTGQTKLGGQDTRDYLVLPKGTMLQAVGSSNYSVMREVDESLKKAIVDLQIYSIFA